MKKYAFILLCCLYALVSCASDNVEPEPVKKSVPEVSININGSAVVFSAAFLDDVKAFLSVAPVYGRALSDLKTFDFMELNYEK